MPATSAPLDVSKLSFEEWIDWREKTAWKGLLANIHPEGTAEGCVVASPSKVLPDYWYQWTRDSALVMRTVIEAFVGGKTEFRHLIDEYISATKIMQHQPTLLGGFHDGGLGDVKYEVDNGPFLKEWSRPQNDGPGSRVITLARYAEWLLDNGTEEDKKYVKDVLYDAATPTDSVIKGDLEHIAKEWAKPGFDLWEEVSGSHFYTLLSIYKALVDGAALADRLSDPTAASYYRKTAATIKAKIPNFWSESKQIIRVTMDFAAGRDSVENAHRGDDSYGKESELDSAFLLATLHAGQGTEYYGSDQVLATLEALMVAMREKYPLNKSRAIPALGRYPEDVYDGTGISLAHPWFLCTSAAAEVLYRKSASLATSSGFVITKTSLPHYGRWIADARVGQKVAAGSKELADVVKGMRAMGDDFVGIVREYGRSDGSLHEQFDRVTGEGRGARDLTWSYAAIITALEGRRAE